MKGKLETPRTDEAYCDAMRSLDGGSSIAIDQMRAQAQQLERELYLREISWKLDIEAWDRDRKWWHEQLASSERRCAELRSGRWAIPDGWKLLKNTTQHERSWTEDFGHENGHYFSTCCECGRQFVGHKRRVMCRVCGCRTWFTEAQWAQLPYTSEEEES